MATLLNIFAGLLLSSGIIGSNPADFEKQYEFLDSLRGFVVANRTRLGAADTTNLIAGMTYHLSGSGVSSSATSMTLTSFTIPQNGYKILDADMPATFYLTLEPGNTTRQEIASCTTVAQNSAGTATLSGCTRGLSPISPYAASTTLQFAHGGGTSVIFSDPPQVFEGFAGKSEREDIGGEWTFAINPHVITATSSNQVVPKSYVDAQVAAGCSDSGDTTKGCVEIAGGLEAASSTSNGTTIETGGVSTLAIGPNLTSYAYRATTTIPVTGPDGKINPAQIATTSPEGYGWTATSTFNGGLAIPNGIFSIDGTTYRMQTGNPSASSTALMNNGSGQLSWGDSRDLIQVGETISSSTSNTISVHNLPARKMYIIDLFVAGASTVYDPSVRFNGDIAGNYSSRRALNFGLDTATTSATFIDLSVGSGFANTGQMTAQIVNTATNPKIITGTAIGPGANAGTETQRIEFSGSWHNTSVSISTITIYSSLSSSLFSTNTRLTIWASKD